MQLEDWANLEDLKTQPPWLLLCAAAVPSASEIIMGNSQSQILQPCKVEPDHESRLDLISSSWGVYWCLVFCPSASLHMLCPIHSTLLISDFTHRESLRSGSTSHIGDVRASLDRLDWSFGGSVGIHERSSRQSLPS